MRRTLTGSLVFIIAASYLLQISIAGYEENLLLNRAYVESGQYYRLFTVALLHGGLWHLAFNLYALHALGTIVEGYFGKTKYAVILFVSLLSGSALSVYFNPAYVYSIGASGMIFGLFGALALIGKRAGVEWRSILVIVGLNFAIGFVLGGVDWRGHLGGLIGGTLITTILNRTK
ncbi:MAG: rhomboid family intramembrane serine protease [Actinomycetota bacterium]|jgi:membrane associated rhomboid family serine protease